MVSEKESNNGTKLIFTFCIGLGKFVSGNMPKIKLKCRWMSASEDNK